MCGIFCSLRASFKQEKSLALDADPFHIISENLRRANAARGPDAQHSESTIINLDPSAISRGYILELYASELRLRGSVPTVQPHTECGDMLCWNGEVFEGLEIGPSENDGHKIFERFRGATDPLSISVLIGSIEGPYAFVFYQRSSRKLYYARDPLGRRSLLIHKPTLTNPVFLLTSVSTGQDDVMDFEELCTEGIFVLDIGALCGSENFTTGFHSNLALIPRTSGEQTPFGVMRKVNQSLPPDNLATIQSLDDAPMHHLEAAVQLIAELDRSVMLRVKDIPRAAGVDDNIARVAVLFSGGIDSTVLAFLAHRYVPPDEPIDLLNVAFENPRKQQLQLDGNIAVVPKRKRKGHLQMKEPDLCGTNKGESSSYMVPDRVTGLQEVEELKRLSAGRIWNFVEINVPYEESQAARSVVEKIMHPSRTVMDLSLALALYFASRGVGRVRSTLTSEYKPYTSRAKVVLSGLGSDEMLGGYGRHRTIFTTKGWQGVIEELQLELDRIPMRNLGRDDRIISSHGKETRHPFLSLSVVSFLAGLPVQLKLDPRLDVGVGDKLLLRVAARKVGLVEASTRKKRAMQFGSHSARMEGGELDKKGGSVINSQIGTRCVYPEFVDTP